MKRVFVPIKLVIALLAVILLSASGAWARPTTPGQAKGVVAKWVGLEAAPMGAALGRQIKEVQTFADESGNPAYYVVYLNPTGMVLVPADDLVEPIIGFLPGGIYDPSPANPLGALVSRDIPGRVHQAREAETQALAKGGALAPQAKETEAQRKWAWLGNATEAPGQESEAGISLVSDMRVSPFIQSHWSQTTVDDTSTGLACYNYFTPPYSAGSSENYYSGCVATAMAQVMRYWQYPAAPVVGTFSITVDQHSQTATIRGGDGSGGNYDWGNMVLDPSHAGANLTQREAIGALTFDAGISAKMSYSSSESGAYLSDAMTALINTFKYSNGKLGLSNSNLPETNRNAMTNPNLHAKSPVIFGITAQQGGHAIVCDGYGYNASTMYHHLNMGWSGYDDAWYNLPDIGTSYGFNSVPECLYNLYITGSGEIIAGRVTDKGGKPVRGAAVSASGGGGSYSATTDDNGIYAIIKVPSNTSYSVSATKSGFTFNPQSVSTGSSQNSTINTGNVWGVDFAGTDFRINEALDNYQLGFSTSGDANWSAETSHYCYGDSAAQTGYIAYGQSTSLQTTVSGPGTLFFYWSVSSTVWYNKFNLYLDGTFVDSISGGVDWTEKTLSIPAGSHTITWKYSKTPSQWPTMGQDCGWLDKVVYNRHSAMAAVNMLLLDEAP